MIRPTEDPHMLMLAAKIIYPLQEERHDRRFIAISMALTGLLELLPEEERRKAIDLLIKFLTSIRDKGEAS